MLRLHFHPSPNPMKAALALEELGLRYEPVPVDTFRGEQHEARFLALNPNAKVPVLEDGEAVVFDSNAILLHLAEREGRLLPAGGSARAAALSWLCFVATGLSPFSGQAVHFLHMCPEDLPYAKNRYVREVRRHYDVMDERLGREAYLGGADYSIADIAAWGWIGFADMIAEGGVSGWPHLSRWFDAVSGREAVARALALKERFSLKREIDEQTRRALFPSNY